MYQLPSNFLCGSEDITYQWRPDVPVDRELKRLDWTAIEFFRWRAAEYLSNIDDLELPGLLSGSTCFPHRLEDSTMRGKFSTNAWPGRYRAKGLFADFRPLILNNKNDYLGSFNRTKNIVCSATDDRVLKKFVTETAVRFRSEVARLSVDSNHNEGDREIDLLELLDLWFNTRVFHVGDERQLRRVRDVLSIFEEEGIEQMLFFELVGLAHWVRCLYAVVENTAPSNPFFSCPDALLIEASL